MTRARIIHRLRSLALATLLATFAGGFAAAQTLHVVAASDTDDLSIGAGVRANHAALEAHFRAVAQTTGLRLNWVPVEGSAFTCANIEAAILRLRVDSQDVIWFHYSAHGLRQPGPVTPEAIFPNFDCSDPRPGFGLRHVAGLVAERGARLAIVAADTCNVPVGPAPLPPVVAAPVLDPVAQRRLFLESSGMIVLSSAQPNEFAWYRANGGLFTVERLLPLLRRPPPAEAPLVWRLLLQQASEPVQTGVTQPVNLGPGQPPVMPGPQGFTMHPQWVSQNLLAGRQ